MARLKPIFLFILLPLDSCVGYIASIPTIAHVSPRRSRMLTNARVASQLSSTRSDERDDANAREEESMDRNVASSLEEISEVNSPQQGGGGVDDDYLTKLRQEISFGRPPRHFDPTTFDIFDDSRDWSRNINNPYNQAKYVKEMKERAVEIIQQKAEGQQHQEVGENGGDEADEA